MDSGQFRLPTYPDLRPNVNPQKTENIVVARQAPSIKTAPIQDSRFPGYAANMQDARFITDYRTHCQQNFSPSKYGESVRGWIQHNADAIIQTTRKRQAEMAGAQYMKAATVPPGQQYESCNEFDCKFTYNPDRDAIGLVRKEGCPELFGTFSEPYLPMPAPTGTMLTTTYEGGRNSLRGQAFAPLAGKLVVSNGVSG